MIEGKNEVNRNYEKALQTLELTKQCVANEKKMQNKGKRYVYPYTLLLYGGKQVLCIDSVTKQATTEMPHRRQY